MTLHSVVVAAWIADVDAALAEWRENNENNPLSPSPHARKRKRARNAQHRSSPAYSRDPPGPRKRRALAPIENNMSQRTLRDRKQGKVPVLSPTPSAANFMNTISSPKFTTATSSVAADSASHVSEPVPQTGRASERSGGNRSRSASPAKKLRDTVLLDKPMRWLYPDKNTKAVLRDHGLGPYWEELESISHDVGIVPRAIKDKLGRTERVFEHMLAAPPSAVENVEDTDISIFDVDSEQWEYNTLKSIVNVARTLSLDGAHESQWNTKVHEPLFTLALAPFQHAFESTTVTTAKPIREFAPSFLDDASDPKVVDFVVCWKPDADAQSRLNGLLRAQDENLRTINQSLYNDKHPALISIETKRGHNDEDDAKYKLAMWMAAWQNSIARFTAPETRCVPLPGLLVFGHTWEMYWMLDCQDEVAIVKAPWAVGDTQTLLGCYRLLAVLRCLCRGWGEEVFLPWFRESVLGDGEGLGG